MEFILQIKPFSVAGLGEVNVTINLLFMSTGSELVHCQPHAVVSCNPHVNKERCH